MTNRTAGSQSLCPSTDMQALLLVEKATRELIEIRSGAGDQVIREQTVDKHLLGINPKLLQEKSPAKEQKKSK